LFTLKGILELAKKGKMTNEENDSYLKRVEVNLSSSIELAKNMVGWSRSKLDNHTSSEKCIEVGGVINEVIDSIQEVALRKNVRIEFNKYELIHALIEVELIKLAVRNIISNAIKFSYPDTTILISVEVKENAIEISIADTGVGMSQEDISKLFTLKKSSSKGTQNESGSGIGLFVVKEFVDLAGGSISVKSEIKKGSTFTVTLPLKSC
jgi:signal transduction histidine kinase